MYGVSKSYHDAIDEAAAMRRKPDETPYQFAIAVKKALEKTDIPERKRNELTRHYFVRGLTKVQQKSYIDRKDKDKSDLHLALRLAVKWEVENCAAVTGINQVECAPPEK